jgi:NO-binding membrane sensor protein with MHYT domain
MAFNPGDILPAQYNLMYVLGSYVVAVMGSLMALYHAGHIRRSDGSIDHDMVVGAAVSLGGVGIWSMHFIGMLGYRLPMTVVYDGTLTFASLLAAVLISGIALRLAGGRSKFSIGGWLAGSVLAGLGVCVMHYGGMYAMHLRAEMVFNWSMVAGSVVIAVCAAAAALWIAFNIRKATYRFVAALIMGLAVCAMHYTGMAAADFVCVASKASPGWTIGGSLLPSLVFGTVGLVLVVLLWNLMGRLVEPVRKPLKQG